MSMSPKELREIRDMYLSPVFKVRRMGQQSGGQWRLTLNALDATLVAWWLTHAHISRSYHTWSLSLSHLGPNR